VNIHYWSLALVQSLFSLRVCEYNVDWFTPIFSRPTWLSEIGVDCSKVYNGINDDSNNIGSFDSSTSSFLSNFGSKICALSGEDKETSFRFRRISVLIQRLISVFLHDSFTTDGPDQ